jgi:superfamily I DNA/RNA helicase
VRGKSEEFGPGDKADRCAELISIDDPERLASELEADPISGTTDEGDDAIELGGGSSTVELLTIVGAKGLSAKHVMVLGCDDVNLDRTTQLAFYVALTRARESLHLIVAARAGGAKAPHEFVLDLPEECCEITVHKKSGADEPLGSLYALKGRLEQWASFG